MTSAFKQVFIKGDNMNSSIKRLFIKETINNLKGKIFKLNYDNNVLVCKSKHLIQTLPHIYLDEMKGTHTKTIMIHVDSIKQIHSGNKNLFIY
jgi:hypothetical protein